MSEKILVVDDEHDIADLLEVYLQKRELCCFQVLLCHRRIELYRK